MGKTALGAIALHNTASAGRALESFVAPSRPDWLRRDTTFWLGSTRADAGLRILVAMARDDKSTNVRGQALFWLAQHAGREAVAAISGAIDNDPETEVKKKAVFALSQLPKDEGVPKLIEVARSNRNPEVRKQAIFWLGQSNDPRATAFFADILLRN